MTLPCHLAVFSHFSQYVLGRSHRVWTRVTPTPKALPALFEPSFLEGIAAKFYVSLKHCYQASFFTPRILSTTHMAFSNVVGVHAHLGYVLRHICCVLG